MASKRVLVDDEVSQDMMELMLTLRTREGMSYRKIEQYLLDKHGYAISYKSIERKLRAYSP